MGVYVQKVGIATGWTWGQITNTCKDLYPGSGLAVRCAYESNASTNDGDSGGPVFVTLGAGFGQGTDLVRLVGIMKGKQGEPGDPGHRSVFSKWNSVSAELGQGGEVYAIRAPTLAFPSLTGSLPFLTAQLSWPAVTGATRYSVFRVSQNGIAQLAGTTTGTSFSDIVSVLEYTGLSPDPNYYNNIQYYVHAVSNTDVSPKSYSVWYKAANGSFSVSIAGPTVVGPNNYACSVWVAQVSGAATIVSYQWSGLFSATESFVTGTVPQTGGQLQVVVVDSQGRNGGYGFNIVYDPNNQDWCQ